MKIFLIFLTMFFMIQVPAHAGCDFNPGTNRINCYPDPPSEIEQKVNDLQEEVDQIKQNQENDQQLPCPPYC